MRDEDALATSNWPKSLVVLGGRPVVLFADNVIDVECMDAVLLVQETILAEQFRPLPHLLTQRSSDLGPAHVPIRASRARARALASASIRSISMVRSNS